MRKLCSHIILLLFIQISFPSAAQKIMFSDVVTTEKVNMVTEILGKIQNHILIFEAHRNSTTLAAPRLYGVLDMCSIYVYDDTMHLITKQKLDLPREIFGVDFIRFKDSLYIFYQYQKNLTVNYEAVKINGEGKIEGTPIGLDKTEGMNFFSQNNIYNMAVSENKKRIAVFKVNQGIESIYQIALLLFDDHLKLIERSNFRIPRNTIHETLMSFNVDNLGNFIFLRYAVPADQAELNKLVFVFKEYHQDSVFYYNASPVDIQLHLPELTIDNQKHEYRIFSLYYKNKSRKIEGIFAAIWSVAMRSLSSATKTPFAKALDSLPYPKYHDANFFNNLAIKDALLEGNGKAFVGLDYFGESYVDLANADIEAIYNGPTALENETGYLRYQQKLDSYMYDWIHWTSPSNGGGRTSIFFIYDSLCAYNGYRVIEKQREIKQFKMINSGDALHFLYTTDDQSQLFSHASLTADGNIIKYPSKKNTDLYQLYLSIAEQVSSNELIVPGLFRNKMFFAKIEL